MMVITRDVIHLKNLFNNSILEWVSPNDYKKRPAIVCLHILHLFHSFLIQCMDTKLQFYAFDPQVTIYS